MKPLSHFFVLSNLAVQPPPRHPIDGDSNSTLTAMEKRQIGFFNIQATTEGDPNTHRIILMYLSRKEVTYHT